MFGANPDRASLRGPKEFNFGIIALILNVVVLAVVSLATRHLVHDERRRHAHSPAPR